MILNQSDANQEPVQQSHIVMPTKLQQTVRLGLLKADMKYHTARAETIRRQIEEVERELG